MHDQHSSGVHSILVVDHWLCLAAHKLEDGTMPSIRSAVVLHSLYQKPCPCFTSAFYTRLYPNSAEGVEDNAKVV